VNYKFTLFLQTVDAANSQSSQYAIQRATFSLNRDELLADYHQWEEVAKDLRAMPEKIVVDQLFAEAVERLRGIERAPGVGDRGGVEACRHGAGSARPNRRG
jgi:hypothetical protein